MEKKVQTLAELKGEEVALRNKIEKDKGTFGDVLLLGEIRKRRHALESILLWTILTLMIFISGCYSIHGIGKDLSTWSSPYIENNEK